MLGPTNKLLFQPTIFNAATTLLQPRALSPRESKLLLDIITKSFRRQLDHEHGAEFSVEEDARIHSKRRRSSQSNKEKAGLFGQTEAITNHHIQSILTNPLLNKPSIRRLAIKSLRDPIEIFDDACARGFMTLDLAAKSLEAKKKQIIDSPELSVLKAMKESGLGRKVLRWYLSSHEPDVYPLLGGDFRNIFNEFLVAEDMQAITWTWLEHHIYVIDKYYLGGIQQGDAQMSQLTKKVIRVLYAFVRAETKLVSVDSGLAVMKRMSKLAHRLQIEDPDSLILSKAALPLLLAIVHRGPKELSAGSSLSSLSNYEFFIGLMTKWNCHLATARLWLDHPTAPDPSYALQFLKSNHHPLGNEDLTDSDQYFWGLKGPNNKCRDGSSRTSRNTVLLAVATASRLLESGKESAVKDAEWIISMLQENYAETLGVNQAKAIEQAKAEAASLELLHDLQLA